MSINNLIPEIKEEISHNIDEGNDATADLREAYKFINNYCNNLQYCETCEFIGSEVGQIFEPTEECKGCYLNQAEYIKNRGSDYKYKMHPVLCKVDLFMEHNRDYL